MNEEAKGRLMSRPAVEAAIQFLRRTQLQGSEVDAYYVVLTELHGQIEQWKRLEQENR